MVKRDGGSEGEQMNIMEFAANVLASVDDGRIESPACGRWAERTLLETAARFTSLAPALEGLPSDLKERYFEALDEIADAMPDGHVVVVEPRVHELLLEHAPEDRRDALRTWIDKPYRGRPPWW